MTTSDAKRFEHSPDPQVREHAKRVLAAAKRRKELHKTRRSRAPGPTRADRKAAEDAREALGKAAAMERSRDFSGIARCEVWDADGRRCLETATDADHVCGGAQKRDMERIGGEGFQAMCRRHHGLKTNNTPTARVWLEQAMEHALRIGAKKLFPFLDRAMAKYQGKHGKAA